MNYGKRNIARWTFNADSVQPEETSGALVDYIDRDGEEVHGADADILDWVVDEGVGSIIFYRLHAE